MGSDVGKGGPSFLGRWAPQAEHAGCWIQSHLGLAGAARGLAGVSTGQWVSSSPPGGHLRVTNSKGSRLLPGDRTLWKAHKSAADVTVSELPDSPRAECGGSTWGPELKGTRSSAVGFWSWLLKETCQGPHR